MTLWKRMRITLGFALAACWACQGGGGSGCGSHAPGATPVDEPLEALEAATEDGQVRLKVAATKPPLLQNKDLGEGDRELFAALPGGEMYCIVYAERKDVGQLLRHTLDEAVDPGTSYEVESFGVDLAGERPFVWARTKGKPVQAAVGGSQYEAFACRAPGDVAAEVFQRAFSGAWETLESPDTVAPPDLAYHSISTEHDEDGNAVGFVDDFVHNRTDGTIWRERYTARVSRTSDGGLDAVDQRYVERALEEYIIAGYYTERRNGSDEHTLIMEIREHTPPKYRVRGKVRGEEFEAFFVVKGALPDFFAEKAELARVVDEAPRKAVQIAQYNPVEDRTAATMMTIQILEPPEDGNNAVIRIGDQEGPAKVSDQGVIEAWNPRGDGGPTAHTRKWSEGALKRLPPGQTAARKADSEGPSAADLVP
ncbi:MAG: hypothetical protein AAF500_14915 [Myxococcota bacterium]